MVSPKVVLLPRLDRQPLEEWMPGLLESTPLVVDRKKGFDDLRTSPRHIKVPRSRLRRLSLIVLIGTSQCKISSSSFLASGWFVAILWLPTNWAELVNQSLFFWGGRGRGGGGGLFPKYSDPAPVFSAETRGLNEPFLAHHGGNWLVRVQHPRGDSLHNRWHDLSVPPSFAMRSAPAATLVSELFPTGRLSASF